MRITSLRLQNFKRFTDLTIQGIPAEAKLVLLLGANGSGKSSVFDAFESLNRASRHEGFGNDYLDYFKKDQALPAVIQGHHEKGAFSVRDGGYTENVHFGKFYGRTSFRQIGRLTRTALGQHNAIDITEDGDRPHFYIDRDKRFENDVEHLAGEILKNFFRTNDSNETVRQRYIQPINDALERIFQPTNPNAIQIIEFIPPIEGNVARIMFRKGISEFHYNQLSAGEKEIFNILLNLLSRTREFGPTLFFLDELDLHLNTELQYYFLKEICEHWIPEESQLWTATHSLGFIQYAQETADAAIIDLDALDFDLPQILEPRLKDKIDVYDVAIPKSVLFKIMSGKRLIVCENQNDDYYNLLALPDTVFVGVQDSRAVFLTVKRDNNYRSLRDRDFLSDDEIDRIQQAYPHHRILRYYDFENYIYHPDNLAELNPKGFNLENYRAEILAQKKQRGAYILAKLDASRMNYEEFKTDPKLKDKTSDRIVEDLLSDDFDRFYKYFDMKQEFKKQSIAAMLPGRDRLVSTIWFRKQIEAVIGI